MKPFFCNKFLNLGTVLFFLSVLACAPAFPQEHMGKGRISGTVVDEEGNPLEGVLITVQSLKYDTKLESRSDEEGHFAVAGMGSGRWRITASKEGYQSSYVDMNISQLRRNPPVSFTLKKMTGIAALRTDQESYEMFDQGNLLIQQEKYEEAIQIFQDFLEKYPEVYQAHLNVGTCYLKKGDLEKAETEFKFVLDKTLETHRDYKEDPQASLRALTGLGELYIQKEEFETAQKYFAQALEISPEDEVAAYNVGEIFFSHQKIDEAIKYFELAIQIKKDWSKPYLKLGYVYLNKGDFDRSLEYFNKFLEMDPENPEVPKVKNMVAAIKNMKK
ncbi:MAG: tetratricopeptide repeat protein [Candidatus Aminicenantes bacterium]